MRALKSLTRRFLRKAGYDIVPLATKLAPDARFGLPVLELLVEALVRRRGSAKVRLLQVGANDGIEEDPVRPLLQRFDIDAAVCEPLPDVFAKLKANYAAFDNVQALQCAVGPEPGSLDLYRIQPGVTGRNDMLVASFDRTHVEHFCRVWNLPIEAIVLEKVPCLTPEQILKKLDQDGFDVAVVDAEGMDDSICESILDLSTPPEIIHFEYVNAPVGGVRNLLRRLDEYGYLFARSGLDVTAARRRG